MSTFSIDNFLDETRFVMRITPRDLLKRLASAAMILSVCWVAGAGWSVAAIAGLIVAVEASGALAARRAPSPDEALPLGLATWMWATNVASTLLYLAPALLLAADARVPFVLAGLIWLFGVFVHISNTYVAMPLYNWTQMVPAFLLGFGVIVVAATASPADAGVPGLWLIVAGLFAVYGVNTVETITAQREIQAALAAARAEAKARLGALERLARHDPLTGLLNRQAFDAGLEGLLAGRAHEGLQDHGVAVLLMDLDGFKPINDTYSHAAGDAVLVAVGRRLRAVAGEEGLAARLGGDEFALAFPDIGSGTASLALAAEVICQIEKPIAFGGKALRISGSIGIALHGGPSGEAGPKGGEGGVTALLAGADQAMYRAKIAARTGAKARAVVYDPADFPPRPSLEDRRRLAEAIAARDIRPGYQPIVDLETRQVTGFEALARWHHPVEGCQPPAAFLPLVAEFGLQGDFLTAMADQVLSDTAALVAEGLDPGRVSFNIPEIALATHSGRADLECVLAHWPQARPHVVFEITEDVFIARSAEMIQGSIAHFRKLGIGIALDDFGTGFASFQHLRSLEFDELKIDASFVEDLGRDPVAEIVVGGFVTMGLGLGARLIAEGVETEEQRRHLIRLGCRFGQGFLFGRAVPFAEARALLDAAQRPAPLEGVA